MTPTDEFVQLLGDWPYDEKSQQVAQESERDRLRLKADLEDAWRVVLDHLPEEMDQQLRDAVRLIEWKL